MITFGQKLTAAGVVVALDLVLLSVSIAYASVLLLLVAAGWAILSALFLVKVFRV